MVQVHFEAGGNSAYPNGYTHGFKWPGAICTRTKLTRLTIADVKVLPANISTLVSVASFSCVLHENDKLVFHNMRQLLSARLLFVQAVLISRCTVGEEAKAVSQRLQCAGQPPNTDSVWHGTDQFAFVCGAADKPNELGELVRGQTK